MLAIHAGCFQGGFKQRYYVLHSCHPVCFLFQGQVQSCRLPKLCTSGRTPVPSQGFSFGILQCLKIRRPSSVCCSNFDQIELRWELFGCPSNPHAGRNRCQRNKSAPASSLFATFLGALGGQAELLRLTLISEVLQARGESNGVKFCNAIGLLAGNERISCDFLTQASS